MSETKHTPGPWDSFKAHDGKFLIHRRDSGYKSLIGFTASSDSLGHGGSEEANARLIAAAPELLEALETAVAQFDFTVAAMAKGQKVSMSSLQNCAANARAALSKATKGAA